MRSLFITAALVSCIALPTNAATPSLNPSSAQVTLAKEALANARKKDFTQQEINLQLLGEHPLAVYFNYHTMLAALPDVNADDIKAFQQQYADSPLANSLHSRALHAYGQALKWDELLAIQTTPPRNNEALCYYWRAKYHQNAQEALAAVPNLWLTGTSMPSACDPLFVEAHKAGTLNEALIWERFQLAMAAQSTGLMRHLAAGLNGEKAIQAEFAQELIANPQKILVLPNAWPEALKDSFKETALLIQAQRDTSEAITLLQRLTTPPAAMGAKARQTAEHKIVWYVLIRDLDQHLAWADQWLALHGDHELFQQRARLAIRQQDWPQVAHNILRFSESMRTDPRWNYWLGRALQATKKPQEARAEFEKAAKRRTFWAFLAADQIKQPYALNNQAPIATPPPPHSERLARIHWLMAMDETGLARNEWLHWMRQQPNQSSALANYALQQGWPGFTVDAAIQMKDSNTLSWRFPLAHSAEFQQAGKNTKQDPYLLMAIARRESAYQHHVISHAGAVGLMQVMPATARQIANWRQEKPPTQAELQTPTRSIELGSTYVERMLDRFHNNRILALAAYNAGPHRVEAWLTDQKLPFDVWVESIPFYETREYVQAVLTYRVLLEATAKQNVAPKQSLLTPAEKKMSYYQGLLKK